MRNRDLTENPCKSGIGKKRPGDKAELRTRATNSSRRLLSTSCALTRIIRAIQGHDAPSVDVHRLHGSEMNRFPHSNKRDQEPVFDRRLYVQFNNAARSRNIELLPKVSQVSPSQGRCKTISVPKGTTDRRSRAQTTPIASSTPKPGEMWTFVFETAGGGTHRQPSRTTLKPNTSRGSQSTQLSELLALWVFNCRDLLARCNVCGYDAFEEPVAIVRLSRPT
jgi:hypothetical protein